MEQTDIKEKETSSDSKQTITTLPKGLVASYTKLRKQQPRLLTSLLSIELVRADDDKYKGPLTHAERVVRKLIQEAEKGNMRAQEIVWERIEGKVPLAITGENDGPIEIKIIWDPLPLEK